MSFFRRVRSYFPPVIPVMPVSWKDSKKDRRKKAGDIMPYGTVRIQNAVFYAHHGVKKEEHSIGGRYEVDVVMELDFEAAASTDDLSKTVDYEKIYSLIRDIVTSNKFYLIERLVYLIARNILKSNAVVREVEVSVRKANPPVGGPCDYAEATYRYERSRMQT